MKIVSLLTPMREISDHVSLMQMEFVNLLKLKIYNGNF